MDSTSSKKKKQWLGISEAYVFRTHYHSQVYLLQRYLRAPVWLVPNAEEATMYKTHKTPSLREHTAQTQTQISKALDSEVMGTARGSHGDEGNIDSH